MNKFDYYDEELEKNIIRTLLLEPKLFGTIATSLLIDDFLNETCKKFFKTMQEMFKRNEKIGLPEVCIATGEPQSITLGWINSEYTSSLYVDSYVKKLKNLSSLRKIKEKVNESKDVKDIISFIKKIESENETRILKNFEEIVNQYEKKYAEKKERIKNGKGIGLVTGFNYFDKRICLEPTHLVCLAAKSSMGKSAFALNLAVNSAMFEQNVLFFSAEMREESLMDRICAMLTNVNISKFKYANADHSYPLAKNDFKKLKEYFKMQFFHNCTSDDVCILARKEASVKQIDLIVVDYLQYLSDKTSKGGTTNDKIGEITRKLKGLAGELNCCVLMLSQVNRKAEGMPELEHLRDSGNIEQDSDLVLMLNREDRHSETATIAVKKAREGEAEIAINLNFNPLTTKFKEL